MTELKAQLEGLEKRLIGMDWKATVPDDVQSEVRMLFNEALAGGPNMNGDGGPLLTPNHALDCVWAAQRIEALTRALSPSPDRLREAARAAFEVTQDAPELSMSNYDHGQVALLNTAMCEVYSILRDALFPAALATPNAQEGEK